MNDSPYLTLGYPELTSQHHLANATRRIAFAYRDDILLGQFGAVMLFASHGKAAAFEEPFTSDHPLWMCTRAISVAGGPASFGQHVCDVVCLSTHKQVVWPEAESDIAAVQYK